MDALIAPDAAVKTAFKWGMPAVAFTDHGTLQAYPIVMKAAKKYPDVKLDDIVKGEAFQSFAAGKVGKVPISEIYGDFLRAKEVFIEEYKNQTAQEYANKQASPGALGGGSAAEKTFFTKDEVDKMSRAEIRKNLPKIEESMKKWKK